MGMMIIEVEVGVEGERCLSPTPPRPQRALIDDQTTSLRYDTHDGWGGGKYGWMEDSQDRPAIAVEAGSVNGISLLWSLGSY